MKGREGATTRRVVHKGLALLVVVVLLLPLAGVAVAQEGPGSPTSLDPLRRVLESFTAGGPADGLFVRSSEGPGSTVASHLQFVVNLSRDPVFGASDTEVIPAGLESGSEASFSTLEEYLGANFAQIHQIPPLDPTSAGSEGTDLTPVLDGWSAYGASGPITGPILVGESPVVVWGIELAEPFDETCSEPRSVGRAWAGTSVVSTNPAFTAEALSELYGDTHSALAGTEGRLIELRCLGAQPIVEARRMTDDLGVRPFTPNLVALVNGTHVVFLTALRTLSGALDGPFYASPHGGGAIEKSVTTGPTPALVPNPYADLPVRIELIHDIAEGGGSSGASSPSHDTGTGETLLYRRDGVNGSPIGYECRVTSAMIFAGVRPGQTDQGLMLLWAVVISHWFDAAFSNGLLTYTAANPDGSVDDVSIDTRDGTFTATRTQEPGSENPDCETGGTAVVTGGQFGAAGTPPNDDDAAGPTDMGDAGPTDTGATPTDDGFPWWLVGLLAVGGAGAWTYARTRTRQKNCRAEEMAYEAAQRAADAATQRLGEANGVWVEANATLERTRTQLATRTSRPDRRLGYPKGADGDARYADDLTHWEAEEAKYEAAEAGLSSAQEAEAAARASRDRAQAESDEAMNRMWAALRALQLCRGETVTDGGKTAPPPEPGTKPPSTPQKECEPDGTTKTKTERHKSFTVLGGNAVTIAIPTAAWKARAPEGRMSTSSLAALSDDALRELVADMGNKLKAVPTLATIPARTLTVKCVRIVVCSGGKWVETEQKNRVEEFSDAPDITLRSLSKDAEVSLRFIRQVRKKVAELEAEEAKAKSFGCE